MDEWKQIEELAELCRSISVAAGDPDFDYGSVSLAKRGDWEINLIVRVSITNHSDHNPYVSFRGRGKNMQNALDIVKPLVIQAAREHAAKHEGHRDGITKALRAATGE